ncbi:hypothetical protein BDB01DRAFT_855617 [Pilobolus umbonatus]|nr:hypothetical protein BDB01DRAFT_855617 [Pilobolus umbonatus]
MPEANSSSRTPNPSQLIRFLNDPKDFSGSSTCNVSPIQWLKKLNRIQDLAALSDKEILLIAADHLTGRAEAWFDVSCNDVVTWSEFCVKFKQKFCSAEDVAVRLLELYALINNSDEGSMIHTFLDALDPLVAREVEAKDSFSCLSLDSVVAAATQVETVNLKYGTRRVLASGEGKDLSAAASVVSSRVGSDSVVSARSDVSSGTIGDLLKEFRDLKISLVNNSRALNYPPQNGNYRNNMPPPRVFNCFHCGEEGHKKPDYPKLRGDSSVSVVQQLNQNPLPNSSQGDMSSVLSVSSSLAATAGSLPRSSAHSVGFVDSLPSISVAGEIYNVKRKAGETVGASLTFPVSVETPEEGSSATPMVSPPPPRKKIPAKRAPPRRIPLSLGHHEVWKKLAKTDAGLNVIDWLALDKKATRDLIDGVRTLRARKSKKPMPPQIPVPTYPSELMPPLPKRPHRKKTVVPIPTPIETTPNEMLVGAVDQWNDGYSEADSVWSDLDSVVSDDTSSVLTVSTCSTEASLVKYPYDISTMRTSAPLKAPISINGHVIEATFDSGAAVSVMNEVGFDSFHRSPCNITADVPIRVAGRLRSEHMCIQSHDRLSQKNEEDYCILGMTWFRAYGVKTDPRLDLILIPVSSVSSGAVYIELQGYSTHPSVSSADRSSLSSGMSSGEVYEVRVANVKTLPPVSAGEETPAKSTLRTYREDVVFDTDEEPENPTDTAITMKDVPKFLHELVLDNQNCFVEVSGLGRVDLTDCNVYKL